MKMLTYRLPLEVDESTFEKLVKFYKHPELTSLSAFLYTSLAHLLQATFSYQPLKPRSPGGANSSQSEAFIGKEAMLVFERAVSPRSEISSTITHHSLSLTAFAITLRAANQLLADACSQLFISLEQSPLNAGMTDRKGEFFIQERVKRQTEVVKAFREGATFRNATYETADLQLSRMLAQPEVREFLLRLLQARYLAEAKYTEEISGIASGRELSRSMLADSFLIRETFIECRKTGQSLARFVEGEVVLDKLQMKCANCGRSYREERVHSAYAPSDKLRDLIESGRWMNILITSILSDLGVEQGSIFWNSTFGSDEIEIIAFIDDGPPWIFKLLDREFGVPDVHPFNYQRSIIKPAEAFVITPATISPDAQGLFEDASAQSAGPTTPASEKNLPRPVLIEGLEKAADILGEVINLHQLAQFNWAVRQAATGIEGAIANVLQDAICTPKSTSASVEEDEDNEQKPRKSNLQRRG
jgi:hypothetical protein